MTLSRILLPLAGAATVALVGCGSSAPAQSSSASGPSSSASSTAHAVSSAAGPPAAHVAHVAISGFAFHPGTVTVASGGKVTFTNRDQTNHTATSNGTGFDTGTLAPGTSKTLVLKKPGTYTYFCQFHAFMKATLVVR